MSSLAIQQIIRDVRDPRTLRLVMVVVVVACSPPRPPLTGHAPDVIDAVVLGPAGPVGDAIVEVVALRPHGCPCPGERAWLVDVPACNCPAALAMWRGALARCALPDVLAVARGDEHGKVAVPVIAGSTLRVTGQAGGARFPLPELRTGLALELAALRSARITWSGDLRDLRAAVVFEDGYCVPLRPGGDTWQPERPFPEDDRGVIVVESRSGLAVVPLSSEVEQAIAIHPTRSVAGLCTGGTSVVLDGAFQHLTAPVVPGGAFRFAGVLGFDATIRCLDRLAVRDSLYYRAEDGSVDGTIEGSLDCTTVEVVGPSGEPIGGAQVTTGSSWTDGAIGGSVWTEYRTDERGRACVSDLERELRAFAPESRGGWCAGHTVLAVTEAHRSRSSPVRLTLAIGPLPLVTVRGHVLSRERLPAAGAVVELSAVIAGCDERYVARTTTALDGTFALSAPRSKLDLRVSHPWYVEERVEVGGPDSRLAIVLDRGATWQGRVLDPDGTAIEHCRIWLEHSGQTVGRASCSASGFALSVLPPGPGTLIVDIEDHPLLGKRRRMAWPVTIARDEHRRADLRWPGGAAIAGSVVDARGAPVAGVLLAALPAGVAMDFSLGQDVVVETDAAGRFAFRHMRAGMWTLHTYSPFRDVAVDARAGTADLRVVIAPQP